MRESSAPYKVVYLVSVSVIGGAEMSLLMLLANLNRQQFAPVVILPKKGPLFERIQALGVDLKLLPLNKINIRNPLPYMKTVWSLVKILRSHRIDLLHCNTGICNQYGMIAAKLARLPVVTHTRNILGKRAFKRMFLGGADVLIANSRAVADCYAKYISKDQRVEIIYNAVDTKYFHPENGYISRSRYNISKGELVIGQIAQITPSKGQDIFIRALAQVVRIHPNVRALIVGDNTIIDDSGWFLDELKQLVKELGLVDKVIFTGFVENMVNIYSCLDMVVLPSKSEGFGRTIAEAMAMTKPIIATKVGGIPEIVVEGKTGLLVPSGDSKALAAAILKVVENPELAIKFSINGPKRIAKLFTIENNVKKTEQVYISLLEKS